MEARRFVGRRDPSFYIQYLPSCANVMNGGGTGSSSAANRQAGRSSKGRSLMVRSAIVIVATLVLLLGIAPISQPQAQNDGNMPSHSKAASTKGRWSDLLAKWRQNRPKLKACRAEARKKGLAGDDRWFFLESCLDRS